MHKGVFYHTSHWGKQIKSTMKGSSIVEQLPSMHGFQIQFPPPQINKYLQTKGYLSEWLARVTMPNAGKDVEKHPWMLRECKMRWPFWKAVWQSLEIK